MSYLEDQKLSILHLYLAHNNQVQLIKIMVHKTMSVSILEQYWCSKPKIYNFNQHTIMKNIHKFTIDQIIQMKGSHINKPKMYQNTLLMQLIKKKLEKETPSDNTRLKLWIAFTSIFQLQELYESLHFLQLPIQFENQIEKDIVRTQTSHKIRQQATDVLTQFAKYNPYIGYCQGMNYIIAFLLQCQFSREQTFFIFKRVTQNLLSTDAYTSMTTSLNDVKILYEMIGIFFPKIYVKLKKLINDMEGSSTVVLSFAFQWFVCLFTNTNINRQITKVIWDSFLIEGITVLFRAALTFFEILEPIILQIQTFQKYIKNVQIQIAKITDSKNFKERMTKFYINHDILSLLRQHLVRLNSEIVEQSMNSNSTKHQKKFKKKCNRNWNACMQELDEQIRNNKRCEVFVFKKNAKLQIVENYLEDLSTKYFQSNNQYASKSDTLLVGRMQHICQQAQQQTLTEDSSGKNIAMKQSQHLSVPQVNEFAKRECFRKKSRLVRSDARQKIRHKVVAQIDQLYCGMEKRLQRSESIVFMKNMVENASFSNLLDIYDFNSLEHQK